MTNNKVLPVEECPMCGEDGLILDISSCRIKNPDHYICQQCVEKFKHTYQEIFCPYCGERPVINQCNTRHQDIDINRVESPTPTMEHLDTCKDKYPICFTVSSSIFCYVGCILNWHLYRMIDHFFNTGETLEADIDWHIYNVFYTIIINGLIIITICHIFETRHPICYNRNNRNNSN